MAGSTIKNGNYLGPWSVIVSAQGGVARHLREGFRWQLQVGVLCSQRLELRQDSTPHLHTRAYTPIKAIPSPPF